MRRSFSFGRHIFSQQTIICTVVLILVCSLSNAQTFEYPTAPTSQQHDTIFGKIVADPYRWMEQPSLTLDYWLEEQSKFSKKYLRQNLKYYYKVKNDLINYGYVEHNPVIKEGNKYYFYQYNDHYSNHTLQQQNSYDSASNTTVVNPARFKNNNENIIINNFKVSSNEQFLAFSFSRSGSDWREIRIKDLKKRQYLKDEILWVKYSDIYWKGDGFFYWKYNKPSPELILLEQATGQKLYYHKIGTNQDQDLLIFDSGQKYLNSSFQVTSEEKYLILYTKTKSKTKNNKVILIKDLENELDFEELYVYPEDGSSFSVLDFVEDKFYIMTNYQANNYRILSLNITTKEIQEVISEYNYVLQDVNIIFNKIVCIYYGKGINILMVFDLEGNPLVKEVFEEGLHIYGIDGTNRDIDTLLFLRSFFIPTVVYKINLVDNTLDLVDKTAIGYDYKLYETRFLRYKSKDGTYIPMYITYKKGTDLTSGDNPVLMYGYGGFGSSLLPHYDPGYILFLKSGGVLVTPQIRGGGELGKKWHEDGKKLKKQNSFDDFIFAAQHLIKSKITNPNKIVINGGSNGGLLVGAVMTQKPNLFKAVVSEMGVLDMLRLEQYGIGYVHHNEYGSIYDSIECNNLMRYSPYHKIKNDQRYPATLVVTADHDDRVPPFHSYKFVARLQATSNNIPFILDVQSQSGHHGSSLLFKEYHHEAVKWGFIFEQLNMRP